MYEHIREALIKIFVWNGCNDAEDLADETVNRVAGKVRNLEKDYKGNPTFYFYGVAKNLVKEVRRAQSQQVPVAEARSVPYETDWGDSADAPRPELYLEALDRCIKKLSEDDRNLILAYYSETKEAKINSRKALSSQLKLEPGALRARAYRIRHRLGECLREQLAMRERLARIYEDRGKYPAEGSDAK